MKYRCCDCDAIFDEDEADTRRECVGEFWGQPAYETYMVCSECGSDSLEEYNGEEDEEDEEM